MIETLYDPLTKIKTVRAADSSLRGLATLASSEHVTEGRAHRIEQNEQRNGHKYAVIYMNPKDYYSLLNTYAHKDPQAVADMVEHLFALQEVTR